MSTSTYTYIYPRDVYIGGPKRSTFTDHLVLTTNKNSTQKSTFRLLGVRRVGPKSQPRNEPEQAGIELQTLLWRRFGTGKGTREKCSKVEESAEQKTDERSAQTPSKAIPSTEPEPEEQPKASGSVVTISKTETTPLHSDSHRATPKPDENVKHKSGEEEQALFSRKLVLNGKLTSVPNISHEERLKHQLNQGHLLKPTTITKNAVPRPKPVRSKSPLSNSISHSHLSEEYPAGIQRRASTQEPLSPDWSNAEPLYLDLFKHFDRIRREEKWEGLISNSIAAILASLGQSFKLPVDPSVNTLASSICRSRVLRLIERDFSQMKKAISNAAREARLEKSMVWKTCSKAGKMVRGGHKMGRQCVQVLQASSADVNSKIEALKEVLADSQETG